MGIIEDFWWVGLILLALIVIGYFMRKGKSNKPKIGKVCKHRFEYRGCLVVRNNNKDYPRQIQYCPKCKECIHLPIRTLSQIQKEQEVNGKD